jgi:hypothetical protein
MRHLVKALLAGVPLPAAVTSTALALGGSREAHAARRRGPARGPPRSPRPRAIIDLLGGQVPVKFDNISTSLPHVRVAQTPPLNHSWHSTLYVSARGLTSSFVSYGTGAFQIDFDFIDHRLRIQSSDGGSAGFALEPQSVSTFHARLQTTCEAAANLGSWDRAALER